MVAGTRSFLLADGGVRLLVAVPTRRRLVARHRGAGDRGGWRRGAVPHPDRVGKGFYRTPRRRGRRTARFPSAQRQSSQRTATMIAAAEPAARQRRRCRRRGRGIPGDGGRSLSGDDASPGAGLRLPGRRASLLQKLTHSRRLNPAGGASATPSSGPPGRSSSVKSPLPHPLISLHLSSYSHVSLAHNPPN